MHTLLIVCGGTAASVLVGFVCYDTSKHYHFGIPIPVGNLIPGDYKVLSCTESNDGEAFAIMERTQDDEVFCVNVTPINRGMLKTGETLKF